MENFCRNCNIIIYFTSSFFRVLFQATRLAQILGKRLEERRKEKQREEERDTHTCTCAYKREVIILCIIVYTPFRPLSQQLNTLTLSQQQQQKLMQVKAKVQSLMLAQDPEVANKITGTIYC